VSKIPWLPPAQRALLWQYVADDFGPELDHTASRLALSRKRRWWWLDESDRSLRRRCIIALDYLERACRGPGSL
jgi:hypothetical protein